MEFSILIKYNFMVSLLVSWKKIILSFQDYWPLFTLFMMFSNIKYLIANIHSPIFDIKNKAYIGNKKKTFYFTNKGLLSLKIHRTWTWFTLTWFILSTECKRQGFHCETWVHPGSVNNSKMSTQEWTVFLGRHFWIR